MGLSVTATYGIVFTASLLMLGVMVNSLIYAYNQMHQGFENRMSLMENKRNSIKIERIVYNGTNIEIIAVNSGPESLKIQKISVLINGTPFTVNESGFWYPGETKSFKFNSSYDLGVYHGEQFRIPSSSEILATCEYDKIYTLTNDTLYAYSYSGELAWSAGVVEPRDVAFSSSVFVLNASGIREYSPSGSFQGFVRAQNFTSLGARGSTLYLVNSTRFVIMNNSGGILKSISLSDGKDVAVGKRVYVLDGNFIKIYDYDGNYLGSISNSLLRYAYRIASDPLAKNDYLLALTTYGNILVFKNGTLVDSVALGESVNNIDLRGKIYLSSQGVIAMDGGYRIKIVDEFGNEFYDYL